MSRRGWRDLALAGLLALLPVAAFSPALLAGRLLAPGDALALHLPMRLAVWRAYQAGEWPSWNPDVFSGTPLLAAYRPGALHPLTAAVSALPGTTAFQVLVTVSFSLAALFLFAYLRGLGASRTGAYAGAVLWALGPALLDRLVDTATLTAAPFLVFLLLALESHLARRTRASRVLVALATALVALAGSPEAAAAGAAVVLIRLAWAGLRRESEGLADGASSLVAVAAGLLLSAPQLVPSLLAWSDAGPGTAGLADPPPPLPGLVGLLVKYLSQTTAPALVLAALFVWPARPRLRPGLLAMAVVLPFLSGHGFLARVAGLLFDLALAVVAGLLITEHGAVRGGATGRLMRRLVLAGGLASALALAVATAVSGALPAAQSAGVALLAAALGVFVSTGASRSPTLSALFLLPFTAGLLLGPWARFPLESLPSMAAVSEGSATRAALDQVRAARPDERVLALVHEWPGARVLDLGYGGLGAASGQRSANGYDPLVPAVRRAAFDGMDVGGAVPLSLLRTDAGRLEFFGIRYVEVLSRDLTVPADDHGLGDRLDLVVDPARPRSFPLPITAVSEVRLASALADSVLIEQDTPVGQVVLHLASGREIALLLRAGHDTAEWAYERPDVTPLMRHARPAVVESLTPEGESFPGQLYLGVLSLPGRFLVDGLRVQSFAGQGRLSVFRVGLRDTGTGRSIGVSATAGYLSDTLRFREAGVTPFVRLFELRGGIGRGRVMDSLRLFPDDDAMIAALRDSLRRGIDPRREAVASRADAGALVVPEGARASRAVLAHASPGHLEFRAEGPGLLVVTEGWDKGWRARVDAAEARLFRVNATYMGLPLGPGLHRVVLRHRTRGLVPGLLAAAAGLLFLILAPARVDRLRTTSYDRGFALSSLPE
jgi:hypothetical protein